MRMNPIFFTLYKESDKCLSIEKLCLISSAIYSPKFTKKYDTIFFTVSQIGLLNYILQSLVIYKNQSTDQML